jgi:3D (Asp-Asp-Asp) domain-containing protein
MPTKTTPHQSRRRIGALLLTATLLSSGSAAAQSKGTGHWTIYYIAEVEPADAGKGPRGNVTYLDGRTVPFHVTSAAHQVMEMQAVAAVRTEKGRRMFTRIEKGKWLEMDPENYGLGNRNNPIMPFVTVAADQSKHPFGSRVFVPDLKGSKLPDGSAHSGYFWVGDSGGRIKGNLRFDLFVGDQSVYRAMLKVGEGTRKLATEVENLPKPPSGYNTLTRTGVKHLLEKLGQDVEGPFERLFEKLANIDDEGLSFDWALRKFQRRHPEIPTIEHGEFRGAVTTWFTTQAALEVARKAKSQAN